MLQKVLNLLLHDLLMQKNKRMPLLSLMQNLAMEV